MKISIMLVGILTLCVLIQGQENPDGFISIDCGASPDVLDNSFGINFQTDAGFVETGEIKEVPTEVINNDYYYQYFKNLRIFPNGTRNCYTLRPKQGKGNTYLVRATFWYGNYDRKNQLPNFHLYIDTNYWTTVDETSYVYHEVIYVAQRDYIQVCLVKTGYGVPFISALELRPLLNSTYQMPPSGALRTFRRFNFGSNLTYWYPQDVYDRFWEGVANFYTSVSNSTPIATATSDDAYKVPEEVLMTAEQTSSVEEMFQWSWTLSSDDPWYAYFHFAEVTDLEGEEEIREMDVYMGTEEGGYRHQDTVRLQNQKRSTLAGTMTATGRNIEIYLEATKQSSLPPLLNALEIFTVLDRPNSQTYEDDFYSINDTKRAYGIVKESWQGDPCLPQNLTWNGLTCSYNNNNDPPRIITLNLSSSNLSGTISTSFSNLKELISLDLSNNGLTGSLPAFFAQLPKLKFLNLTGNRLNGTIPELLKKRQQDGTIQLRFDYLSLLIITPAKPSSYRLLVERVI